MKTNRRGFFGAIAGLVGGVYAAFQKGEAKATVKPVDLTTMADEPKPIPWGNVKSWSLSVPGGLEPGELVYLEITYSTGDKVDYEGMPLVCTSYTGIAHNDPPQD
jgi:hypothetical protein